MGPEITYVSAHDLPQKPNEHTKITDPFSIVTIEFKNRKVPTEKFNDAIFEYFLREHHMRLIGMTVEVPVSNKFEYRFGYNAENAIKSFKEAKKNNIEFAGINFATDCKFKVLEKMEPDVTGEKIKKSIKEIYYVSAKDCLYQNGRDDKALNSYLTTVHPLSIVTIKFKNRKVPTEEFNSAIFNYFFKVHNMELIETTVGRESVSNKFEYKCSKNAETAIELFKKVKKSNFTFTIGAKNVSTTTVITFGQNCKFEAIPKPPSRILSISVKHLSGSNLLNNIYINLNYAVEQREFNTKFINNFKKKCINLYNVSFGDHDRSSYIKSTSSRIFDYLLSYECSLNSEIIKTILEDLRSNKVRIGEVNFGGNYEIRVSK